MKYNTEQFRTALLTDKVNNYWTRFTEDEWTDILNLAAEKIFDEDYEAELYESNSDAYQQGYDDGWDEGRADGHADGYNLGYVDGLVAARGEEPEDGV